MRVYRYQLCGCCTRGPITVIMQRLTRIVIRTIDRYIDLNSHHRCIIRKLGGNAFHSFLNSHIQIPYTPLIVDIGP